MENYNSFLKYLINIEEKYIDKDGKPDFGKDCCLFTSMNIKKSLLTAFWNIEKNSNIEPEKKKILLKKGRELYDVLFPYKKKYRF